MKNKRLLLVEDEPFLAKVITDSLEQKGYVVSHAPDGKKGYNLFQNGLFDLLILDVMLPHTDGFTLARQVRQSNEHIPILFLTAKTTTGDVIEGYQSGGNDYLKKPFSLEELFLRIDELLKRTFREDKAIAESIMIGDYSFNHPKQELALGGHIIQLSHREAELLWLLYKNKNRLTERKMALLSLWGDDSFFNTRTMDVFITRLRKHLQHDEKVQIINVRGMGYKLIC